MDVLPFISGPTKEYCGEFLPMLPASEPIDFNKLLKLPPVQPEALPFVEAEEETN